MITLSDLIYHPNYDEHLRYVQSQGSYSLDFFGGTFEGGALLQQTPEEFAGFLTFLSDKKVTRYLEIGSASGAFMHCMMNRLPILEAVMIDDGQTDKEKQDEVVSRYPTMITRHIGDSHAHAARRFLENYSGHVFDLVFIDGDHSFEGVMEDIDLVLPYCGDHTLIAFHDIYCSKVPGVGQAYGEALKQGKLKPIAEILAPGRHNPLGISVCLKA